MADAPPIQPDSSPPDTSPDLPPGNSPDMSNGSLAGGNQDMLWSQVWQLPVLLFGLGLLVIGVYLSLPGQDPDDFHGKLANAQTYLEKDQLDEAEVVLEEIRPRMNEAPVSELGYFWQLYGDLTFQKLFKTGVVGRQGVEAAIPTYEKIVAHYNNARDQGHELTGPSLRNYIRSLVALDRDKQALALLDQMTGTQAAQRYLIVRDMIERRHEDRPGVDLDSLMPLLERFREDIKAIPDKTIARQQEIWSHGFQASLFMQTDNPQTAIAYLLRHIQRLAARDGDDDLGPLIVKLAQAYQSIEDYQNAEQRFLHAQRRVAPTDDLNADILVGLGQLALAQATGQQVEEALEYFRLAEEGYPSSASGHISALIGRADCEARLGDHAAAGRYFDLAVREMLERTRPWDPRRADAAQAIRTQFERAADLDEFDLAKDYLDVLALLQGDEPSTQLLLDLASTSEKIGDQRRDEVQASTRREPGQPPLTPEAKRLANQQSAEYYALAADYYYQHAAQVTVEDNDRHGQSLWSSALNYDRAQMWDQAIRVYEEFIQTRNGDSKRLRAIRNLARAYMANRQYKPALAKFQHLIEDYPRSPETYSSLVLMAQCLDAVGQTDKAIDTLTTVIDDHEAITPDSGEYRLALIELGRLYHRKGEKDPALYARAIELLTEAVQRYGDTEDGPRLRFLLADAFRRSVPALDQQMASTQSQAALLSLQDERKDRLQQAQVLYNQAINGLEAKKALDTLLGPVEELYLRNAYFYQADCAYDRRVFEQSILLYNTAANNYSDDPASLVARIQIVNAYCELGKFQQAKIANDNARRQLERIPDEAFEDENLPMKREHWEDWLRWTSELNLFASQVNAAGVGG
jgi:tetratricopeptide (TPR) repeat protein